MHVRKNFIPQQKVPFLCANCGKENHDDQPSPRNHCKFCLYSLHVDKDLPGDRASLCNSKMKPIRITYTGAKGYSIVHECMICKKQQKNKVAMDDDMDMIIKVTTDNSMMHHPS